MNPPHLLIIPPSLEGGHEYLLLEKSQAGVRGSQAVVIFVDYTACPAVVVVQNADGIRRRCPRECLVEVQTLAHYVQGRQEVVRLSGRA